MDDYDVIISTCSLYQTVGYSQSFFGVVMLTVDIMTVVMLDVVMGVRVVMVKVVTVTVTSLLLTRRSSQAGSWGSFHAP